MAAGIPLTTPHLRLPRIRPSLLDSGTRGDSWVGKCSHPDLLVMYLNNQPITLIPATRLDQNNLNNLLFGLRHRLRRDCA
jgi:hypothetical protein